MKDNKRLKVQYKNWSCYQTPYTKSSSGYVQHLVCNDLRFKKDKTDGIIIRSTKRQLYRYLKWYVDNEVYKHDHSIPNMINDGEYDIVEVCDETQ